MRNVRILIVAAFSAFFKQGGGETEAIALNKALAMHGAEAELYGPMASGLESYDLVIFFSCHPSGLELLFSCNELGIKFIFWPNFWIGDERRLNNDEIETVNTFCRFSDRIVMKSQSELNLFQQYFSFDKYKIMRINWFIDSDFCKSTDSQRFKDLYGLNDYFLTVGLLEPIKNQLNLIRAAQLAEKKIVHIGGFRHKQYYEECRQAAKDNVVFIPHIPSNSPILKAAYSGCEAFIEVSLDPPGRSALEAAFFKKILILSDSTWAKEIFHDTAILVNPNSVESIQQSLESFNKFKNSHDQGRRLLLEKHLPDNALSKLFQYIENIER